MKHYEVGTSPFSTEPFIGQVQDLEVIDAKFPHGLSEVSIVFGIEGGVVLDALHQFLPNRHSDVHAHLVVQFDQFFLVV